MDQDKLIEHINAEALAYGIVAGAALVTLVGLFLAIPTLRRRWLPLSRLRPGAWTGSEVFFAFCIFFGFRDVIAAALLRIGFFTPLIGPAPATDAPPLEQTIYAYDCLITSSPLSFVVVMGMLLGMMYARAGARPHHYGLSWSRPIPNTVLGLATFIAARPLIMGTFLLAALVFPPAKEPLEELAKRGMPEWEWTLFVFQMIVAAPIVEEVVCRGILQNWLRRATLRGHMMFLALALFVTAQVNASAISKDDYAPLAFIGLLAAGYVGGMVWLRRRFALTEEELPDWQVLPILPATEEIAGADEMARAARERMRTQHEERAKRWADANATLAIYGSALFFAAMHSNWPGPIALFPMGLALGWMARRTQSLLGPITFHALFNLTTFIALIAATRAASAE